MFRAGICTQSRSELGNSLSPALLFSHWNSWKNYVISSFLSVKNISSTSQDWAVLLLSQVLWANWLFFVSPHSLPNPRGCTERKIKEFCKHHSLNLIFFYIPFISCCILATGNVEHAVQLRKNTEKTLIKTHRKALDFGINSNEHLERGPRSSPEFQPSQQHPLEMFLDSPTAAAVLKSFNGTNLLVAKYRIRRALPRKRGDIWI